MQSPYFPHSSLSTTTLVDSRFDPSKVALSAEVRSPKQLSVRTFLPLPTPTGDSTPILSSLRVLFPSSTPTWIATPPTPPPKPIRRSNSSSSRRPPFLKPISPSASFPASMHPHAAGNKRLKRSSSVPTLSTRSRNRSHTFHSVMGAHLVHSPKEIDNPIDGSCFTGDGKLRGPATTRHAGLTAKTIFHIGDGVIVSSPDELSPEGSWSDHSVEDIWETERHKDSLRRFHALKELLATEVGYFVDLKALVTVYLRNLPTLAARSLTTSSTFGRASASFTSGPWVYSYTQLQAAAISSSATLPETQNLSSSTSSVKEPKTNSRYLFSDTQLESLTRNAEEILQLHEHFVKELRYILEPLGFAMEHDNEQGYAHLGNLDSAIRAVSTKFATEVCLHRFFLPTVVVHLLCVVNRLRVSTHTNFSVLDIQKPWT